jgi:hypothetical protein
MLVLVVTLYMQHSGKGLSRCQTCYPFGSPLVVNGVNLNTVPQP